MKARHWTREALIAIGAGAVLLAVAVLIGDPLALRILLLVIGCLGIGFGVGWIVVGALAKRSLVGPR